MNNDIIYYRAGFLLLNLSCFVSFLAAFVLVLKNNSNWFFYYALANILLGFILILTKPTKK